MPLRGSAHYVPWIYLGMSLALWYRSDTLDNAVAYLTPSLEFLLFLGSTRTRPWYFPSPVNAERSRIVTRYDGTTSIYWFLEEWPCDGRSVGSTVSKERAYVDVEVTCSSGFSGRLTWQSVSPRDLMWNNFLGHEFLRRFLDRAIVTWRPEYNTCVPFNFNFFGFIFFFGCMCSFFIEYLGNLADEWKIQQCDYRK